MPHYLVFPLTDDRVDRRGYDRVSTVGLRAVDPVAITADDPDDAVHRAAEAAGGVRNDQKYAVIAVDAVLMTAPAVVNVTADPLGGRLLTAGGDVCDATAEAVGE